MARVRSIIRWRASRENPCKVCKALIKTGRSRYVVCTLDIPEYKLFTWGGHLTNMVRLVPLVGSRTYTNYTLSERLHLEAEKLYSARRVPKWIGAAIASRKLEGKPVDHLRELMSMNRLYTRALVRALDDMGILGPCERIYRRLEKANADSY